MPQRCVLLNYNLTSCSWHVPSWHFTQAVL